MDKRTSGVMYRSFVEAGSCLNDEQRGKYYKLIFDYMFDFVKGESDDRIVNAMFILVAPQIEANINKYKNGKVGGRPKEKPKQKQKETKEKPKKNQSVIKPKGNEDVYDNENEDVYEKEIITKEINPPAEVSVSPIIKMFVETQLENVPSITYHYNKDPQSYLENNQKEYQKLLQDAQKQSVPSEAIDALLQKIPDHDFWKNQIGSIAKLRKKDKEGTPYRYKLLGEFVQKEKSLSPGYYF